MAKRIKRLEKGVKSLKIELNKHFDKLQEDIDKGNFFRGRYHAKEIEASLLKALQDKLSFLNEKDEDLIKYKEKLDEFKKILEKEK
jgi:hypothetical protein